MLRNIAAVSALAMTVCATAGRDRLAMETKLYASNAGPFAKECEEQPSPEQAGAARQTLLERADMTPIEAIGLSVSLTDDLA